MELYQNTVLQYISNGNERIRIIYMDKPLDYCYVVSLKGDTAMPQHMLISNIDELIKNEELVVITEPYSQVFSEDEIPYKYKFQRDKYWDIVEYVWNKNRNSFLDKPSRSRVIEEASILSLECNKKVRRVITRFLQRGMKKNALLFDYKNSGGRGKFKKSNGIKRGRKRAEERTGEVIEGINVDETIVNIIKVSINLFYLKKEKKTLAEAYSYMLLKFYADHRVFNGEEKSFVWDKSRIPSYRQFVYWYHILTDQKESIIKRNSENYYELKNRPILSNSTIDCWGPGSRYQIDATVADVYMVSIVDRERVIGRPIVYGVIDVFSRLVCGIYVGLEGPSWIGAMMALDNIIEDKVEFSKRYGVVTSSDKWPNSFFPEKILADRGEFEGYNVENLINNLNIKIENTAPYRGDMKGIIERNFRTTNEKIKHKTPGAIAKEFRERGDRDYRLDAVLDIREFTAIIINEVINHNTSIISGYPMDFELIKGEIAPVPSMLWKWGIENRRCAFKYVEREVARLNLMYRKIVTITRKGIQFNSKMHYGCDQAIKEQWYLKRVNEKIKIVYDPRQMNFIYIPLDNGTGFIKCNLLDKNSRYKDLPIEEVIFMHELENEIVNNYQDTQNQVDVDYIESVKKIIENAEEKSKSAIKITGRQKIKNIRISRAEEKDGIRNIEAFELDKQYNDTLEEECQSTDSKNDEGNNPISKLNLFRKIRSESSGG